jgi:hypothetical protein
MFLALCCTVLAQAVQQTAAPAAQTVINGALNPEKISDPEAIKVLLIHIMAPAQPTPEQAAEQQGRLGQIGLSSSDLQAVSHILSQFFATFTTFITEAEQVVANRSLTSSAKADTVRQKIISGDALCDTTWAQLLASVSPDGRKKLVQRIEHVKRHIKIISPPAM